MKDLTRYVIMFSLLTVCVGIIYYYRFVHASEIVFTHIFYIPIVCACFWWAMRGLYVVVFLGSVLIISDISMKMELSVITNDFMRVIMFAVVGSLIGYLRARNIKSESEISYQNELLKASEERFKIFSRHIIHVKEEERKRLAADFHDDLGALSVSLNSQLDVLEDNVKFQECANALGNVIKAKQVLKKYVRDVKDVITTLRPPEMEFVGIDSVLNDYCLSIAADFNIDVEYNIELDKEKIDEDISIVLYRVSQEAMSNILKHAGANKIVFNLSQKGSNIELKIEDNGKGFNAVESYSNKSENFGIEGMRQRVEALGGTFTINSLYGKGTSIMASIPHEIREAALCE